MISLNHKSSLVVAAIHLGVDLGLFRSLAESESLLTVGQIAEPTRASSWLLRKF